MYEIKKLDTFVDEFIFIIFFMKLQQNKVKERRSTSTLVFFNYTKF